MAAVQLPPGVSPSSSIENMSLSQLPDEIAKFPPKTFETTTLEQRDDLKQFQPEISDSNPELNVGVPELELPSMEKVPDSPRRTRVDETPSDTCSLISGVSNEDDSSSEAGAASKSETTPKVEKKPSAFHKWAQQMGVELERKDIKDDTNISELERSMQPKVIGEETAEISNDAAEISKDTAETSNDAVETSNDAVETSDDAATPLASSSQTSLPHTEYKLTEEMVKEEEKIAEETKKEEDEYERKKDEVMKDMSEETKEKRYKRLCFLLNKCNSYADYLVVRMKEHAEENRIRGERRARKLEKRAQKEAEKKRRTAEAFAAQQSSFTAGDDATNAEQLRTRTETAEPRTAIAGTRTETAEPRTEVAEPRTETAEPRTEVAEPRTETAEPRTEISGTRTETAEVTIEIQTIKVERVDDDAWKEKESPMETEVGPLLLSKVKQEHEADQSLLAAGTGTSTRRSPRQSVRSPSTRHSPRQPPTENGSQKEEKDSENSESSASTRRRSSRQNNKEATDNDTSTEKVDSQTSDSADPYRGMKRARPAVGVSEFILGESRRKRARRDDEAEKKLAQATLRETMTTSSQNRRDSIKLAPNGDLSKSRNDNGDKDDSLEKSQENSTKKESSQSNCDEEEITKKSPELDHNNNDENDIIKSELVEKAESCENTVEDDADMRIINGEMVPVGQPVLFEGGVLRNYQMDGFMWLSTMFENGTNGILADEMGLGKTVQVIATIADLVMQKVYGSFIVIAPLSTLPNWMSEFKRFTPRLPVFLYHGTDRKLLRNRINDWFTVPGTDVETGIIIVTSYEMAMNDSRYLKNSVWKYMVIDEGHRLKNFKCRLIKELSKYDVVNRLLLTGTPLQNNMAELWSLLNFLLPDIFMDLESFESWFDMEALSCDDSTERIIAQERKTNILSMLHQILTPFILRRLKQDVDLVIPPKREIVVYAPLTKRQHFFYAKTINKTLEAFLQGNKDGEPKQLPAETEYTSLGRPKRQASKRKVNYKAMMESENHQTEPTKKRFDTEAEDKELDDWVRDMEENKKTASGVSSVVSNTKKASATSNYTINLRNDMMLLRKCVNHPYLLEYPLTETGEYRIDEDLVDAGGKLLILDRMLPELKKRGHKCLVFSQMTSVLDILEDYCYLRDYKYSRLDGAMNLYTRQEEMESFRSDPDRFLFLLSTKAGGLGLNLVAADTVIIYDSDWNPQGDLQAQDRCHRIGQTVPVVVYRLVTAGTIDEKMIEKAATKRKLEKMIIHQQKFKTVGRSSEERTKALDTKELVGMLRSHEPDSVFDSHRQSVISNRVLLQLLDRQELYDQWLENMESKGAAGKKATKAGKINKDVGVAGSFQIVAEDTEDQLRF